jgi:hypothetical protein
MTPTLVNKPPPKQEPPQEAPKPIFITSFNRDNTMYERTAICVWTNARLQTSNPMRLHPSRVTIYFWTFPHEPTLVNPFMHFLAYTAERDDQVQTTAKTKGVRL